MIGRGTPSRVTLGPAASLLIAGLLIVGCGSSPSGPGPVTPPPGGGGVTPTPNQPPRIESLTAQKERIEVDEEIAITAVVSDPETPVDQLKFEWQSDAGTFSGEGPVVKWRVPASVTTPADYTVKLTVTETYGVADQNGVRPQHVVAETTSAIRVHNSVKELGDMSMRFLTNFADSSVPASVVMQDFTNSCPEARFEREEVEENRLNYQILSSRLRLRNVSVASGSTRAHMTVSCEFWSRIKRCVPGIPDCVVGATDHVDGDCLLTGVYETRRWWLCDSKFDGQRLPLMPGFFGSRRR